MAQKAGKRTHLASATVDTYDHCYKERSRPLFRSSLRTIAGLSIVGRSRHRGWQLQPPVRCSRSPICLREAHDRFLGGVGGPDIRARPSVEGVVAHHPVSGD